jgi:membrane associated rhomboid family serine protease
MERTGNGWRARSPVDLGSIHAYQLLFVAHCVGFIGLLALPEASHVDALDGFAVGDLGSMLRRPWTLLTHPFVHRTPLEFLVTTLLLLWIGGEVERALGGVRFVLFLCASSSLVGLAHAVLSEELGPLLTGGLGATAALLTAHLFVFWDRRTLGIIPAHYFYALAALLVAVTAGFVDLELTSRATGILKATWESKNLTQDEFLTAFSVVDLHRADAFGHLFGFAAGGAALFVDLAIARARDRARTRREIQNLEEEVVARAKVEQLLEKISREGIKSLSARERKFLRYASQRFYRDDLLKSAD